MRIAFAGLRHVHILMLHRMLRERDDVEIVAVSEAEPAARQGLADGGEVQVTHDDYPALLADVDCDAVAIGDYYGRRGEIAIAALQAGRHVISDKPLCTRPAFSSPGRKHVGVSSLYRRRGSVCWRRRTFPGCS